MPNNGDTGPPTSEQILAVLAAIQDPDLGRDVVSLGMIKDLVIGADGKVAARFDNIVSRQALEALLQKLPPMKA